MLVFGNLISGIRFFFRQENSSISLGMFVMVFAMLILPGMDALAKLLTTVYSLSPAFIAASRFLLQTTMMAIVIVLISGWKGLYSKYPLIGLLRGCFIGISSLIFFISIQYIMLVDALAVFFIWPIIVMLLSPFVLNETIGWRRGTAAIVAFSGMLLVMQPNSNSFSLMTLSPAIAAFSFSLYILFTRYYGKQDNPLSMQLYSGIGGFLICSIAMIAGELLNFKPFLFTLPQVSIEWLLIFVAGFIASFSHLMIVFAFKITPAAVLVPLQYLEIFSATLLGLLLFGNFPDGIKWFGIFIIIVAGIYIFFRERKLENLASKN